MGRFRALGAALSASLHLMRRRSAVVLAVLVLCTSTRIRDIQLSTSPFNEKKGGTGYRTFTPTAVNTPAATGNTFFLGFIYRLSKRYLSLPWIVT